MKAQTISLARNPALDNTPLSVLDSINSHLKRLSPSKKIIPLHQGKTVFTTPVELRHWDDSEFDYPPHHDGPPGGTNTLIEAIREKLETQFGQEIDPGRIQVTCGITHGLSIIFHCILLPGDEVIILSPQWLFAKGLVRASGGVPVEVPFFPATGDEPIRGVTKLIAPYLTAKTRAIYFNSPNNPTGRSLSRTQLEELADFAGERGLYLVADNAYEFYDYTPDGFIDPAMLHDGRHHTFSAYSFSKSFGMTGYRIGYLLSPPDMAELARKFALHSIYSVATPCQFAALSAMRVSPEIVDGHREFIKKSLDITNQQLRVPASIPDGGFYALLDLSAWQRGTDDFIHACVSEGVSLAPGRAFGTGYDQYARLCYSVVSHEDLKEGIRIINDIYERNS